MGYCCQIRCQHVAHSWQMGWAGVQQLDPGDIPPGTTVSIKLAPLAVPAKAPFVAGVRINATWISGLKGESLFVAYRALTAGTPDTLVRARRWAARAAPLPQPLPSLMLPPAPKPVCLSHRAAPFRWPRLPAAGPRRLCQQGAHLLDRHRQHLGRVADDLQGSHCM